MSQTLNTTFQTAPHTAAAALNDASPPLPAPKPPTREWSARTVATTGLEVTSALRGDDGSLPAASSMRSDRLNKRGLGVYLSSSPAVKRITARKSSTSRPPTSLGSVLRPGQAAELIHRNCSKRCQRKRRSSSPRAGPDFQPRAIKSFAVTDACKWRQRPHHRSKGFQRARSALV